MSVDSFLYQGRGTLPVSRPNLNRTASSATTHNISSRRLHSDKLPRSCSDATPRLQKQSPPKSSTNGSNNKSSSSISNSVSSSIARTVSGMIKKRKHIVLLGLDGSGKTTLLMRLKYGCRISTAPTIGFNHEKVWGGGFRWSAWDVGGGEKFRPLWVMYARATDGLVFVIDASSSCDVIDESRVELSRVIKASKLSSHSLNTSPPPVLILANFQDRSYAKNVEEISTILGLSEPWASGILWAVAPVCGLTGEGLEGALCTLRTLIDGNQMERKRIERRWRW